MRTLLAILSLFFIGLTQGPAQTFNEWFRQKKTDIRYLTQQIAAYEVYLKDIEKGYQIAQSGLDFIGEVKKGEFHLHQDYFNSLAVVNPAIAGYSKAAAIISIAGEVIKLLQVPHSDLLSGSELEYLGKVNSAARKACYRDLSELTELLTADIFTMQDNERLERIEGIFKDMKELRGFLQTFSGETRWLVLQRTREKQNLQRLQNQEP